ncbi:MAG: RNA polymerase sigma factor [Bacteroidota bacterium]
MSNSFSTNKPDNLDLIRRLKSRDKVALREAYEQYGGALLHLILKLVPDRATSEEILQDTFVKVWEKATQFDENKGRLFSWMAQIARNTAIDRLRSGNFKRWEKTDTLEADVSETIKLSESLKIKDSGLRKIVDSLDEKHRQLIDYLYFQDYTQKEASEALGIPLGTVKTRIRAAILELRKLLSKEVFLLIAYWLLNS